MSNQIKKLCVDARYADMNGRRSQTVSSAVMDAQRARKKKRGAQRRKSHEQFVSELKKINPNIEVVGRYETSSSHISVKCRQCGHEWSPIAASIVNTGQGCPICARKRASEKRRKDTNWLVNSLKKVNPNIEIAGEYKSSKEKVACQCRICGNEWTAAPSNLLNGYGCPRCAKTGTSFMEQFLCVFLEEAIGEDSVLSRDKKAIGRELDILIPKYKLAIEIGSWHWHKNRLESDIEKESLCRERGIELITIYDCCPENIDAEIPKNSRLFSYSLREEKSHKTLRKIALEAASMIGININDFNSWDRVVTGASRRSLPMTTEEFKKNISVTSSTVEVLGEYRGSHTKISCRCKTCNNEWTPTAGQLLRGQGCPRCGKKKAIAIATAAIRKNPEEYAEDFKTANPTLTLLSKYAGSLNRVSVRCDVCGHEWSPRAESVIRGNGCPICANNIRRKPPERFLEELLDVNPHVEILGSYEKSSKPIETRCKKCGHIWHPRPSKLLAGQGCPKCAGKMKTAVRCIETGEVYSSLAAAASAVGLSSGDTISAACKGRRKSAGGYRWEYDTQSQP